MMMMMRNWWFWNVLHRLYWHVGQLSGRVHGEGPLIAVMGDSLTDPYIGFTFPRQVWVRRIAGGGYKTVNLGNGGDTTTQMCERVEEFLVEGQPEIAVLFAGCNDVEHGLDPALTERNITFIVKWLHEHGIDKIVVVGPGFLNLARLPDWLGHVPDWEAAADAVRAALREVAARNDAVFVDFNEFLRARIARGQDPDFSRVPYRQSRSWHALPNDSHFNAYGHRLLAEAFFSETAGWLPPARPRRRWLPVIRRRQSLRRSQRGRPHPSRQAA
jgi:lysophospholipase L1-like esterase